MYENDYDDYLTAELEKFADTVDEDFENSEFCRELEYKVDGHADERHYEKTDQELYNRCYGKQSDATAFFDYDINGERISLNRVMYDSIYAMHRQITDFMTNSDAHTKILKVDYGDIIGGGYHYDQGRCDKMVSSQILIKIQKTPEDSRFGFGVRTMFVDLECEQALYVQQLRMYQEQGKEPFHDGKTDLSYEELEKTLEPVLSRKEAIAEIKKEQDRQIELHRQKERALEPELVKSFTKEFDIPESEITVEDEKEKVQDERVTARYGDTIRVLKARGFEIGYIKKDHVSPSMGKINKVKDVLNGEKLAKEIEEERKNPEKAIKKVKKEIDKINAMIDAMNESSNASQYDSQIALLEWRRDSLYRKYNRLEDMAEEVGNSQKESDEKEKDFYSRPFDEQNREMIDRTERNRESVINTSAEPLKRPTIR